MAYFSLYFNCLGFPAPLLRSPVLSSSQLSVSRGKAPSGDMKEEGNLQALERGKHVIVNASILLEVEGPWILFS
jgi:hypothetical protein